MTDHTLLERLLNPRSVAVVGASPTTMGPASQVVGHLRRAPQPPTIYPVNPRAADEAGFHASVADLPEVPDVVVVGVAAAHVAGVVRDAADAGVRVFVVFTSGFAEAGAEGQERQRLLTDLARERGLLILGPNSVGVLNFRTGTHLSFTSALSRPGLPTTAGGAALVSQSGALAGYLIAMNERAPLFDYVFSMGNEVGLHTAETVDFLADDPHTRVIGLYLEGVRHGREFLAAVRRARRNGKAVVVLPVGEGSASARAASSHTAAMTSAGALTRLLATRTGAHVVRTPEQMSAVIGALLRRPAPRGRAVGIVTATGGGGAVLAEQLERAGLEVPVLGPEPSAALREVLPPYVSPANPCDTGASFYLQPEILTRTMAAMAAAPEIDQVITVMGAGGAQSAAIAGAIVEGARAVESVHQLIWFAAPEEARAVPGFEEVALAPSLDEAVATARALTHVRPDPDDEPVPARTDLTAVADLLAAVRPGSGLLAADVAREVLGAAGTPMPAAVGIPLDAEQRLRPPAGSVEALRFPVAAKISSPDIAHKTEVGGVLLEIQDSTELLRRLEIATKDVATRAPAARLDGWTVEAMVPRGVEVLVSARVDPSYGPVVVVGAGGVTTELRHDVDARLGPVTEDEAAELVAGTGVGHLLNGFRGAQTDLRPLARVVSRLSHLVAASGVTEVECNPVVVAPDGEATIVDVLVRV